MQITLQFSSTMRRYFSDSDLIFNLRDNATLADLYNEIGKTHGDELSSAIWNHEKSRFRGPVVVSSNKEIIKKEDTLLAGSVDSSSYTTESSDTHSLGWNLEFPAQAVSGSCTFTFELSRDFSL